VVLPFFRKLTLRGQAGEILWGHRSAATLAAWSIARLDRGHGQPPYTWHLRARVARADAFQCRQRPLLFTAPRGKEAPWCWGVESLDLVGQELRATLGPPEQ
jgi:hypothetical protein